MCFSKKDEVSTYEGLAKKPPFFAMTEWQQHSVLLKLFILRPIYEIYIQ
jgi:hypothetical protein